MTRSGAIAIWSSAYRQSSSNLIAEIGVANLFVNFVSQPEIANLTHEEAGRYLTLLWGRDDGGPIRRLSTHAEDAAGDGAAGCSIAAFAVMLVTVVAHGPLAMWALISVGRFHSIMFPTIFTIGIRGLGPLTEEGSGLLIVAIAGGALVVV